MLAERSAAFASPEERAEIKAYQDTAHKNFYDGGTLEFDDNAVVSRGDDPGAYVLAWKWVPNSTFPLAAKLEEIQAHRAFEGGYQSEDVASVFAAVLETTGVHLAACWDVHQEGDFSGASEFVVVEDGKLFEIDGGFTELQDYLEGRRENPPIRLDIKRGKRIRINGAGDQFNFAVNSR
jgi:hypothetical protein